MTKKGLTLVEGLLAGAVILILAVPMLLGVLDTRRRARDAMRVSEVRQAQAALEAYRSKNGSYPPAAAELDSDDAALAQNLGYVPSPDGCGAGGAGDCRDYLLRFRLEGALGALPGGACTAGSSGLSCSR